MHATVWRRDSGWLRRVLDVTIHVGDSHSERLGYYTVEYNGRGWGFETVLVNGVVADRRRSFWFAPRFAFHLGLSQAVLLVRVWPWLTLRSFELLIDGQPAYVE